jgi:YVTN family beta-propeller protein
MPKEGCGSGIELVNLLVMGDRIEIGILGQLVIRRDGHEVAVSAPKQRLLLVLLLLRRGELVPTATLIDKLWVGDPPATVAKVLQVYVSQLRKVLGDGVLQTGPGGYRLRLESAAVDAGRFEQLLERGLGLFAEGDAAGGDAALEAALALWRGPPLAEFRFQPFAAQEIDRLEELRLLALTKRLEAQLALGRAAELVAGLQSLVRQHPLQENLWRLLMLALYRAGRQADALAAYQDARTTLVADLGIDPGEVLQRLEAAILAHDPSLDHDETPPAAPRTVPRQPYSGERVVPRAHAGELQTAVATSFPPSSIASSSKRPGWSVRRQLVAVGALVLVPLLVFLVAAARRDGGGQPLKSLGENSVSILNPNTGHLLDRVGVDPSPTAAATGFNSVWTANTGADTVSRIAISTRASRSVEVGSAPSALAVGLNSIWVANSGSGTVSRIDPTTNSTQTITVGTSPGGLAVANGWVWVTNTGDGTVSRIDPSLNRVTKTIDVGDGPSGIGAGQDVWVANSTSNTVIEIDARSGSVKATFHVGNDPRGVVVAGDSVWVANNLDGTISRIATAGTSGPKTVPVGLGPTQIAAVGRHLWVATQTARAITEVDPQTGLQVRTVPIGATPTALVGAGGQLWVTTTIDPVRHIGGTINLLGQDPGSLDPHYPATPYTYWVINSSYDGLVGVRHTDGATGTVLVPDLATSLPAPTNGDRTYTFRLRSGIRWSTGASVTVFDVQRGLERGVVGGVIQQNEIAGTERCTPRRCSVSGIVVDPLAATVSITLVRPRGDFLAQLSTAYAVPAATPMSNQGMRALPATGPYEISNVLAGKVVHLTRNPYFREWSVAAQPAGFPDQIIYQIDPAGDDTKAAAAAVAGGRADWADARGAGTIGALQTKSGSRLHITPTETSHGVYLNTRVAPFNDVRVRRALAFAIDRQAVASDWFTPATVTCQVLPPNFPGYRPYCPYTLGPNSSGTWRAPDLATALSLVRASHTKGMAVTVTSTAKSAAGMRHVVSALAALGYHARLRVLSDPNSEPMADSRNKVQASFGGSVAVDPSAADFIGTQFACAGYAPADPANPNNSEFCDPAEDKQTVRAEQLQSSSPDKANQLWAQIDQNIVDAAPWIALVNPSWVDVVSPRIHNYVRNSFLGVLFDQMWVR